MLCALCSDGSQVVMLDAHEIEAELSLRDESGGAGAMWDPAKRIQGMMDHHHGSYAQELDALAGLEWRRQRKHSQNTSGALS